MGFGGYLLACGLAVFTFIVFGFVLPIIHGILKLPAGLLLGQETRARGARFYLAASWSWLVEAWTVPLPIVFSATVFNTAIEDKGANPWVLWIFLALCLSLVNGLYDRRPREELEGGQISEAEYKIVDGNKSVGMFFCVVVLPLCIWGQSILNLVYGWIPFLRF